MRTFQLLDQDNSGKIKDSIIRTGSLLMDLMVTRVNEATKRLNEEKGTCHFDTFLFYLNYP